MVNPVVHFEIGAADDRPLLAFYGELFGWGLRAVPGMNYTLVDTRGGAGISGGIGKSGTGEAWVAFYVEVDDPQAYLDKAGALGATTVVPVIELPGMATFAMFDDPDGLLVGLVHGEEAPQAPRRPSDGDGAAVDWFEVLGADAGRSQAFYAELFGWDVPRGDAYELVGAGAAHGIGGGIGAGGETRWATVYASVGDVEAALARAEALGATRLYGPNQVDDHTETGAFRDPAGNVFGVYYHGPH
jgi:predicted enzyme related to lactoylglutathione lyase